MRVDLRAPHLRLRCGVRLGLIPSFSFVFPRSAQCDVRNSRGRVDGPRRWPWAQGREGQERHPDVQRVGPRLRRGRRRGEGTLSRPALRRRPRSASGGVLETRGRGADPRSVPTCRRVVQCVSPTPDVSPARTLGHPATRGRGAWSSPRHPPPAAAPSPLPHLSVIRAPAAWGRRWAGLPALPPQGPHLILLLSPAFHVA